MPDATAITAAVGRAIRDLRGARGMTARDLAARSGISAAMISRIEGGSVSPSLATLEQLAAALQTPVVSLFREADSAVSDFTLVRQGAGLRSTRLMGAHAHEFAVLGFHRRLDLQFESLLVTVERNEKARPPSYTGHGCVFVYMLEGSATYRYGNEEMRLDAGDSISLDAELRYGIQEVLTPRIRFLSVQAERR
jgi:transcriptional regulator with XRE-family HTH domain